MALKVEGTGVQSFTGYCGEEVLSPGNHIKVYGSPATHYEVTEGWQLRQLCSEGQTPPPPVSPEIAIGNHRWEADI
jgi:hypothetical protein